MQLNFLFQEPADRDISFLQRSVLYEMAYASAARVNKLQRNVVTCVENKEKEEHQDFLHLRLRFSQRLFSQRLFSQRWFELSKGNRKTPSTLPIMHHFNTR